MKCHVSLNSNNQLKFYPTEAGLATFLKSALLFLPFILLMASYSPPLIFKLLLALSYFVKVGLHFSLAIDAQGFFDLYQGLIGDDKLMQQEISHLQLIEAKERSLQKVQEAYLLGVVMLLFGGWTFFNPHQVLGSGFLMISLLYELLLFYFKAQQLQQRTTQCVIRLKKNRETSSLK